MKTYHKLKQDFSFLNFLTGKKKLNQYVFVHPWKWHEPIKEGITVSACIPMICTIFYSRTLTREESRKMKNLLRKSLFRVSVLFVYALFGGGLFYCIEKKPEDSKDVYLRLSRELQTNFTNKFNVSMNEEDFKRFIYRAFEVVRVRRKADWNFLSSLSFTLTTLATVGKWHLFLR